MCNALRELMKEDLEQAYKKGYRKGWHIGLREGIHEAAMEAICNMMDSQKISMDQAMDYLEIPADDRDLYRAKITEGNAESIPAHSFETCGRTPEF